MLVTADMYSAPPSKSDALVVNVQLSIVSVSDPCNYGPSTSSVHDIVRMWIHDEVRILKHETYNKFSCIASTINI